MSASQTATSEQIKAKRGDIAVIVTTRRDFVIGEGTRESTTVDVCEVTSITRDGLARVVRKATRGTTVELRRWVGSRQVFIVPKSDVDVAAAMEAAGAHPWPSGHPGMPYDSPDEVKALLRSLKR